VNNISNLRIKIFADGANLDSMIQMAKKPFIKGLTTNPTLMRQSGVTNYREFAKSVLTMISDKPISFEVFSDNLYEMKKQALEIASWAENVYVKIPISNSDGTSTTGIIYDLSNKGVKVNVTACLTTDQVVEISKVLNPSISSCVSLFAGRIADTGINPIPIMQQSLELLSPLKSCELIWASPRELLNVIQANEIGCHIITATSNILDKLPLIGKDLNTYSLETVRMFKDDAAASGFNL
jgi:transaldolase